MFLVVRGRLGTVDGSLHDILAACGVQCGDSGPPEAGSLIARLTGLRHVLNGFWMILTHFCGSGPSWVPGGRQEAHPDAK